ncbi:MAG: hypothetical protein M1822_000499 [Bathelium mastoideum]|nr:MAG: hypothetical protein M1822_000499 [Bathelium mastoideum]
MEAIAAGASVVALISLAGQCVSGAESLKDLFSDVKSASKTVESFLRDINGLLKTLHDVENILDTISKEIQPDEPGADVASLKIQLEDCLRDVSHWIQTARELRMASKKGAKSWVASFWVTVNKKSVGSIQQEISRRRAEITTSLQVLSTGIKDSRTTERVEAKVDEGVTLSTELLSNSIKVEEVIEQFDRKIERLDETAKSILSNSEGSLRSLQSICSSGSHLAASWGRPPSSPTHYRRSSEEIHFSDYRKLRRSNSSSYAPYPHEYSTKIRRSSSIDYTAVYDYSENYGDPIPRSRRRLKRSSTETSWSTPPSPLKRSYQSDAAVSPTLSPKATTGPMTLTAPSNLAWNDPRITKELNDEFKRHSDQKQRQASRLSDLQLEDEQPLYTCSYCREQFRDKTEAEAHQRSWHAERFSWSCAHMSGIESAFYRRQDCLLCSYCGESLDQADPAKDNNERHDHLTKNHRFGECNQATTYSSVSAFRKHLQQFHKATLGIWSSTLESASLVEQPTARKDVFNTLEPSINMASTQLEILWHRFKFPANQLLAEWHTGSKLVDSLTFGPFDEPELGKYISRLRLAGLCKQEIDLMDLLLSKWPLDDREDINTISRSMIVQRRTDLKIVQDQIIETMKQEDTYPIRGELSDLEHSICDTWESETLDTLKIRSQSYDASLISNWTGSRDRVNRWILHSLGTSEEQAKIHRSMLPDPDISVPEWGRLVLKYWFLDEAATGAELEIPSSAVAAESWDASSLLSFGFETCKSFQSHDRLNLSHGKHFSTISALISLHKPGTKE